WNKDVRLSDLVGRKQKEAEEPTFPTPDVSAADEVQPPAQPSPAPVPMSPVEPSPVPPVPPREDLAARPEAALDPTCEPEPEAPSGESVPWYKRELSLGRKPKATKKPKAEQPKEKKQKQPKEQHVPFYKRELSFGRQKGDAPKATKQPNGAFQTATATTASKQFKRVTGLKIGGSQLAAARVHNNGVPELVQVARQELEPGVIVGGELRDPDALVAALRAFFKRHKLPRQGVRLGIANNRIGVRTFELSGIDDVHQLH